MSLRSFQIQPEEILLTAQIGLPAIRRKDRLIEELMGEIELGGTLCWADYACSNFYSKENSFSSNRLSYSSKGMADWVSVGQGHDK